MSRMVKVALLPLVLAWSLVRLLVGPVLIVAVVWWLVPDGSPWFLAVCGVVGFYLVVTVAAWWAGVRGALRSLGRGTVHVASPGRRRPGRGK